ncbi:FHA domain-containing protein [Mycobacterium sp. MUNTM1]
MAAEHAGSTTLTVHVEGQSCTLCPADGVAVIGRDSGAAVRLADDRISRWHVRLEPRAEGWQAIDTSTNGLYVDGIRRSSVLISGATTVHLGDPAGIPVVLTPSDAAEAMQVVAVDQLADPDAEQWWEGDVDPGIMRAGRAVAARRNELEITQRSLARDKIINAGTLSALEKGRSWPRRSTLARLEKALDWAPGTIARLRSGDPGGPGAVAGPSSVLVSRSAGPREEATEVLTDTVHAPLMAEAVEFAMHNINARVTDLPDPADAAFTPKATSILVDLHKLETLAATAARTAKGSPSVVLALSTVRRTYNDLMMRAARSPSATLGQRLYEARHRAELSLEEAANAAGLLPAVLGDVEAERPVPADAAGAIENLVAQLATSPTN